MYKFLPLFKRFVILSQKKANKSKLNFSKHHINVFSVSLLSKNPKSIWRINAVFTYFRWFGTRWIPMLRNIAIFYAGPFHRLEVRQPRCFCFWLGVCSTNRRSVCLSTACIHVTGTSLSSLARLWCGALRFKLWHGVDVTTVREKGFQSVSKGFR